MNIIFHHPLPLDSNAKSASGIRPLRMLKAFEALGCHVELVTGYPEERKNRIRQIKNNIRKGIRYDFVYSESSTMPTVLTEAHHLPLHPLMDWLFFRYCKKNTIPIGLFYRDIYWRFHEYGQHMNPIKRAVAKAAYYFDLWVYQQTLSKLYLPSVKMGRYIPLVNPALFEALPPGHASSLDHTSSYARASEQGSTLKLFYVGGMSEHYQLHKLFDALEHLPQVELTLCTRQEEWQSVLNDYPALPDNINVIHETGYAMERYLKAADIAILFVKPQEYREFAAPVKLYEYLGFCKPILASEGTLAGQFVSEHSIGWTIPYNVKAAHQLLEQISMDPALLESIHKNLQEVMQEHSWQARSQKVIKELTQPAQSRP